ncbi:putative bifunctional diguanylate cyclase/phosphodiesterase [Erwinia phyllosphaerae]|uniref:putative bifunctional diguanylate cyclase/phosphodiesterase n=1 Tax=Erwinia phyllosphaerae TaxID=2853256 RepID=UPI001FEE0AE1|nr:EAL domain-containing protein [Erwinia phyllosphaerae]MBV4365183.1 EAL domain-containing protein [Erwinia phyllosphaerae]
MKISDSFRSHFIREVLIPLVLVLLITFTAATFTVWWATAKTNRDAAGQQQRIIQTSLSQSLAEMIKQNRSLALWQPLGSRLERAPLDILWLNQNVGAWLTEMFGHQLIYILDEHNQPVYRWEWGENVPVARFEHLRPPVTSLLNKLKIPFAIGSRHAETVDFTLIDKRPAALAISAIDNGYGQNGRFRLVSVKYLDSSYLDSLAQRSLLRDLHYADGNPLHKGANYLLTNVAGEPLGYISWRPSTPGSQMFQVIGPVGLVMVLIITLICVLMIRRLWLSSSRLSQSLLQLSASEAQAQHLAFHDVLTGLPNRALVEERLTQALGRLMRSEGQIALLLLDLDRFKLVNDTYGHHAGDELIIDVGHRLSELVRENDTVGRLGGDEFVVILEGITSLHVIEQLCERIIASLARPFTLLGSQTWIGVSIGVATAPQNASDRLELMRKADIALYEAKSQGRGQHRIFDESMDESVKKRQQIAGDLRIALQSKRDLAVYYQPLMDIAGQKVVGLEALIRWNHPVHGLISPGDFIPLAEEMGLIIQLGEWVLREACRVSLAWPDLSMAINVSPLQFRSAGFVERVKAIVKQEKTQPSRIELEITEGVLIEDEKGAQEIMSELRQAGFRIALDDFGTGYSSLNYLRHFSVDKIKIDRSFTQSLGVTENSTAIIESVVRLGQAMGLTVTAEGVETSSQMQALAEAGCNQLQGFLFSHAVAEEEIKALLTPRKAS